jgi:hypothetical protein
MEHVARIGVMVNSCRSLSYLEDLKYREKDTATVSLYRRILLSWLCESVTERDSEIGNLW